MQHSVSIIGAGTAGLITAKRLGLHGFEPVVYDQKPVLGIPIRASGILSISGLERLGMDYSGCVTNSLYGANIHAAGRMMEVLSKTPVAKVLDRKKLNDSFHDQAAAAGARVVTRKRIVGKDLDALSARGVVVGADGAVSSVARHFGLGEIDKLCLTYKAEYDMRVPDSRMVDLFFDRYNYPGLFAWLCPNAKDILEVGVGLNSGSGNAKAAFDRFVSSDDIRDLVGSRKPISQGASIIPMSLRKRIVDPERKVLLVGDAAGQVKPTTGGGIIFGGSGAIMAADVISGYLKGTGMLDDYEMQFRKTHGLDLKLHSVAHSIYSSLSPSAMGRLIGTLNAFGIDKFLGTYGDMDRPSLIIKRFFLRSLAR